MQPTTNRDTLTTRPKGPTEAHRKSWADQQIPHTHKPTIKITGRCVGSTHNHRWIQAKRPCRCDVAQCAQPGRGQRVVNDANARDRKP